jgi:cation:H+ antiporter
MAVALALPLFVVSLTVTLAAARLFARRLDVLGVRFGLSETVIGLLTAVAADGPELASALVALASGERAVSAGVVVGSNIFNIAAMVGLTAVLVGGVRLTRTALALEGTVAVLVTLIATGVLLEALAPAVGLLLLLLVIVPYLLVVLAAGRPHSRLPLPSMLRRPLTDVLVTRTPQRSSPEVDSVDHRRQLLLMVADVVLIVLGSLGMVESAVALGERWGISPALIGVLLLGPLTSIPNAQTAIRLGKRSRGEALVSETFASNTINLLGGVLLPALFVEVVLRTHGERLDLLWLWVMTGACLVGLARRRGLGRAWGGGLLALYLAFVAFKLLS